MAVGIQEVDYLRYAEGSQGMLIALRKGLDSLFGEGYLAFNVEAVSSPGRTEQAVKTYHVDGCTAFVVSEYNTFTAIGELAWVEVGMIFGESPNKASLIGRVNQIFEDNGFLNILLPFKSEKKYFITNFFAKFGEQQRLQVPNKYISVFYKEKNYDIQNFIELRINDKKTKLVKDGAGWTTEIQPPCNVKLYIGDKYTISLVFA